MGVSSNQRFSDNESHPLVGYNTIHRRRSFNDGRPPPYHAGFTDSTEPPLTIDDFVARVHANRQGMRYGSNAALLKKLPDLLRVVADHVLSGKAQTGDVAYAVAALIDLIESAPAESDMPSRHRH